MVDVAFLMTGALVGVSVAAPVGPMGMLCINRTLSQGMAVGVSTGVGASTVQVSYCCILLLGLHEVGPWLEGHKQVLGLLSGLLLLAFAWRLLRGRRAQPGGQIVTRRSMLAAYGTAVALNVFNPLSVMLLLAAIAATVGPTPPSGMDVVLLLGGLFVGSVLWWFCLSGAAALLRSRLDAKLLGLVNIAAGVALALSGVLTLVRTVHS